MDSKEILQERELLISKAKCEIIEVMKRQGFWDYIMQSDQRLDRVKVFLDTLEGTIKPVFKGDLEPKPQFLPIFPGLSNKPLYKDHQFSWSVKIKENYSTIKKEFLNIKSHNYSNYNFEGVPQGLIHSVNLRHLGVNIKHNASLFPKTLALIDKLDNICNHYPFGEAVFSSIHPGAHIPAHHSVDNLRVRCMLGVKIPPKCRMRVEQEYTGWVEGELTIFDDSFQHEVWNEGDAIRTLFIIDFWHPDLTSEEIEALRAGFMKKEIRNILLNAKPDGPLIDKNYFRKQFELYDKSVSIHKYWSKQSVTQ